MTTMVMWLLISVGHGTSGYRPSIPPTVIERFETQKDCEDLKGQIGSEAGTKCLRATVLVKK